MAFTHYTYVISQAKTSKTGADLNNRLDGHYNGRLDWAPIGADTRPEAARNLIKLTQRSLWLQLHCLGFGPVRTVSQFQLHPMGGNKPAAQFI